MLAYQPLVQYVACRLSPSLPAQVEEADLIAYVPASLRSNLQARR